MCADGSDASHRNRRRRFAPGYARPMRRLGLLALLVASPVVASAALTDAPPPPIVSKPIPYGPQRRVEMAAYARRHYGASFATWRLVRPRVIVEHYTAN